MLIIWYCIGIFTSPVPFLVRYWFSVIFAACLLFNTQKKQNLILIMFLQTNYISQNSHCKKIILFLIRVTSSSDSHSTIIFDTKLIFFSFLPIIFGNYLLFLYQYLLFSSLLCLILLLIIIAKPTVLILAFTSVIHLLSYQSSLHYFMLF